MREGKRGYILPNLPRNLFAFVRKCTQADLPRRKERKRRPLSRFRTLFVIPHHSLLSSEGSCHTWRRLEEKMGISDFQKRNWIKRIGKKKDSLTSVIYIWGTKSGVVLGFEKRKGEGRGGRGGTRKEKKKTIPSNSHVNHIFHVVKQSITQRENFSICFRDFLRLDHHQHDIVALHTFF